MYTENVKKIKKYDLEEESEMYTEAYKYIEIAIDELPDEKIKDNLIEIREELKCKINDLKEQIEERDAEDYKFEINRRQKEYREMQGF